MWAPGTLPSAATVPVLVALIKEALQRPAKVVASAVPVRGIVRSARPTDAGVDGVAEPVHVEHPTERVPQPGEVTYHSTGMSGRAWKMALITGLAGFAICAVIFTVPELLTGQAASGGDRGTTLFGGQQRDRSDGATTTTTTTTTTTQTVTERAKTVTVPAETEAKTTPPTTTVPPLTTESAPETTTAPPATTPEEPVETPEPVP